MKSFGTPVMSFGPLAIAMMLAIWPYVIVKERIEFRKLYGRWR